MSLREWFVMHGDLTKLRLQRTLFQPVTSLLNFFYCLQSLKVKFKPYLTAFKAPIFLSNLVSVSPSASPLT